MPTISLDGDSDGVMRADGSLRHRRFFAGPYSRRVIDRVGHNLPQEAPQAFAAAVLELVAGDFKGDTASGP